MSQASDDFSYEDLLKFLRRIEEPTPDDPDESSSQAEAESYDSQAQAIQIRRLEESVKIRKQDRKERKKYATRVFVLVCVWLAAVLVMLFLQGVRGNTFWVGPFELSDSVLMMLIGSTTASVVAIFVIVARHLFPRRDSN